MPVPQQDTSSWFRLEMDISVYDKSWSETYIMKGGTFDVATPQAKCLALWRAAILARDAKIDYAVVIQSGPARTSRVALDRPVQGTSGTKFDNALQPLAINCNTPGDGLQIRMETDSNRHADRAVKGMPDGWINSKKYQATPNPPDYVDFGAYTLAMDATAVPEEEGVWEFNKVPPYTTAQANKFKSYDIALQQFFKAVFNFTTSRYPALDGNGNPTYDVITGGQIFVPDAWRKFVYRYATARTVGDPN